MKREQRLPQFVQLTNANLTHQGLDNFARYNIKR